MKKAQRDKRKDRILVAINIVPFKDETRAHLQEICIKRITDLKTLNVVPLNICFSDEVINPCGWTVLPSLSESADRKLNVTGKRKPFVIDLFDAAAEWAMEHGIDWFIISNSDIIFTPNLIHEVRKLLKSGYETIAISRNDVENVDLDQKMLSGHLELKGYDVFACQTAWWKNNRYRFQPYILGERAWDNAYAAIMGCHSKFHVFYTNGLCFHLKHPIDWQSTGYYSDYNMSIFNTVDKQYQDCYNRFMVQVLSMSQGALTFEETARLIRMCFYII